MCKSWDNSSRIEKRGVDKGVDKCRSLLDGYEASKRASDIFDLTEQSNQHSLTYFSAKHGGRLLEQLQVMSFIIILYILFCNNWTNLLLLRISCNIIERVITPLLLNTQEDSVFRLSIFQRL